MMPDISLIKDLSVPSRTKLILVVMDGLGGLPDSSTGKTELETAITPNLDKLASAGMCGMHDPVSVGITPGSGPGHLGLFGYDPVEFLIGRGVLEGMGIDFPLGRDDVAARGNFCTVDDKGLIVDRRAGRIATELSSKLCIMLSKIHIKGAEVFVRPVKEHRFLIVFRGKGLSASMEDTDPERTGVAPKPVKASTSEAGRTASIVTEFITKASKVLSSHQPANMLLMRGFSKIPELPRFNDVYKLKAVAIASYPMYKGLARLLGMSVIESGSSFQDAVTLARDNWSDFDYFFIHFKKTDAAGEDGDFIRKVRAIEEVDSGLPSILSLEPDVLAVTGDHSTPAIYQGHSWHSVPFLISSKWCRPSRITKFGEQQCSTGNIGTIKGLDIMPLIMAHGQRLTKYGA